MERDGYVPRDMLGQIAGGDKNALKLAEILVRVGLWEDDARGGWQIHDFLEYNTSAEQNKEKRDAEAARKASWRAAKTATNGSVPQMSQRDKPRTNVPKMSRVPATRRDKMSRLPDPTRPLIKEACVEMEMGEAPTPEGLAALEAIKASVRAVKPQEATT
jgi:hypothetical protein